MSEKTLQQVPIVMRAFALCLWLGGMAVLGAVVAPSLFRSLPDQPLLAGKIFGQCLQKHNWIALFCAALILLAEIPSLRAKRPLSFVRLAALFIAAGITLHLQFNLFPEMEARRAARQMDAFDKLHRQYTREASFAMYALLPLLATVGVEIASARQRSAKKAA